MGMGSYTRSSFENYSVSRGRSVRDSVVVDNLSAQEMFTSRRLDPALDPKNVIRESCDSVDHPVSKPVIIGIDVTGSMGETATEVAKKIGKVIEDCMSKVPDIHFMVMGIGDLAYDQAPIQISQFESDIRIVEQLDKIWFEGNGGGNSYESYSAAWYMGLNHTKLDSYSKRGQRGIIITLGDEEMNPYLPMSGLKRVTGDSLQDDVDTRELYKDASKMYDIYHLHVNHGAASELRGKRAQDTFSDVLGADHFKMTTVNGVVDEVTNIIINGFSKAVQAVNEKVDTDESDGIEPCAGVSSVPVISW